MSQKKRNNPLPGPGYLRPLHSPPPPLSAHPRCVGPVLQQEVQATICLFGDPLPSGRRPDLVYRSYICARVAGRMRAYSVVIVCAAKQPTHDNGSAHGAHASQHPGKIKLRRATRLVPQPTTSQNPGPS